MRFVQQDSYDLANRFAYGDGNPIVNSDPSGHFSVLNFTKTFALSAIPGYGTYISFERHDPRGFKMLSIISDVATVALMAYVGKRAVGRYVVQTEE